MKSIRTTEEVVKIWQCMEKYKFNYHNIRQLFASYAISNSKLSVKDLLYTKEYPTPFTAVPSLNKIIANDELFKYEESKALLPEKSEVKRMINFLNLLEGKKITDWEILKLTIVSIENCEVFGEDVVKGLYGRVLKCQNLFLNVDEFLHCQTYCYRCLVDDDLFIPSCLDEGIEKFRRHSYTVDTAQLDNVTDKLAYIYLFLKTIKNYRLVNEYDIDFTLLAKMFSRELSGVMNSKEIINPKEIEEENSIALSKYFNKGLNR